MTKEELQTEIELLKKSNERYIDVINELIQVNIKNQDIIKELKNMLKVSDKE